MKSWKIESKDNQAGGQWSCQKQTDRTPEPSPEERRYDNRQRGHPRTASQHDRLNDVIRKQLKRYIEENRKRRLLPTGRNRNRQSQREKSRYPDANIGQKSQDKRKNCPKNRIRNYDQIEPNPHGDCEPGVHLELHEQKSAQTRSCLINRKSTRYHVRFSYYPEKAITQALSFQQHEHHENDNDCK